MTATPDTARSPGIRSLIPARIDRLPWSKFHTRLVIALGVAWVLDGLEITIASNVGPDLTLNNTLHMSASAVADLATWYLIGEANFHAQCREPLCRGKTDPAGTAGDHRGPSLCKCRMLWHAIAPIAGAGR